MKARSRRDRASLAGTFVRRTHGDDSQLHTDVGADPFSLETDDVHGELQDSTGSQREENDGTSSRRASFVAPTALVVKRKQPRGRSSLPASLATGTKHSTPTTVDLGLGQKVGPLQDDARNVEENAPNQSRVGRRAHHDQQLPASSASLSASAAATSTASARTHAAAAMGAPPLQLMAEFPLGDDRIPLRKLPTSNPSSEPATEHGATAQRARQQHLWGATPSPAYGRGGSGSHKPDLGQQAARVGHAQGGASDSHLGRGQQLPAIAAEAEDDSLSVSSGHSSSSSRPAFGSDARRHAEHVGRRSLRGIFFSSGDAARALDVARTVASAAAVVEPQRDDDDAAGAYNSEMPAMPALERRRHSSAAGVPPERGSVAARDRAPQQAHVRAQLQPAAGRHVQVALPRPGTASLLQTNAEMAAELTRTQTRLGELSRDHHALIQRLARVEELWTVATQRASSAIDEITELREAHRALQSTLARREASIRDNERSREALEVRLAEIEARNLATAEHSRQMKRDVGDLAKLVVDRLLPVQDLVGRVRRGLECDTDDDLDDDA